MNMDPHTHTLTQLATHETDTPSSSGRDSTLMRLWGNAEKSLTCNSVFFHIFLHQLYTGGGGVATSLKVVEKSWNAKCPSSQNISLNLIWSLILSGDEMWELGMPFAVITIFTWLRVIRLTKWFTAQPPCVFPTCVHFATSQAGRFKSWHWKATPNYATKLIPCLLNEEISFPVIV